MLSNDFLLTALKGLFNSSSSIGLANSSGAEIAVTGYQRQSGASFNFDYNDSSPSTPWVYNKNPVYYPELTNAQSYTAAKMLVYDYFMNSTKLVYSGDFESPVSVVGEQMVKIGRYAVNSSQVQTRGIKIELWEVFS